MRPKLDPNQKKQNTTIRLEPDLRKKLEAIAEFEYRPLANQIHVFLIDAVDRYLTNPNINYDKDSQKIFCDLAYFDAHPNDPKHPMFGKWTPPEDDFDIDEPQT